VGRERFDVVIVGAGSAGLGALREVRRSTDNFVLINDGPWGTMCARVGCMPSKALIEAANAFHRRHDLAAFGVRGGNQLTVDRAAVLARVREVRDGFVAEARALTQDLGERAISGRATLLDGHRVRVNGEDLTADRIILAPGSRPSVPGRWTQFADRLLTTDSLFEQETLPDRIAVLGLGGVGAEVAQALARLGCTVAAFDAKTTIAGLSDEPVNATLVELLRREFALHLGQEVALAGEGPDMRVTAGEHSVAVERVVVALGRTPNLEGLGLEGLGVHLDKAGRPEVDPTTMEIGRTGVFLVGDAAGDRPIQHEASDEGRIAGRNARAESRHHYRRRVPLRIVFTDPEVAIVGARHASLDGDNVAIGETSFADQSRARLGLRSDGRLRVYAEKRGGLLLGAELCAPDGEHLAHLLALAIERGSTVADLLRAPFYHPTIEEGLRSALRDVAKALPGGESYELPSDSG
jgi:dihydrolipoamide dehydrogenase